MRRNNFYRVQAEIERQAAEASRTNVERFASPSSVAGQVVAGGVNPSTGEWAGYWQLGLGQLGSTTRLG